ncbi:MAG: Eco57I restriction-modification methylase domain-containing protein, partial [Vicinamibacterales bacterium]
QALIHEGSLTSGDIDEDDRAGFRRMVAQQCLFGVDVNPMAVQLGRLSLWLATLSADKPLTFLDHHLRTGNSLVGSSIEDIQRQPAPGGSPRTMRELPLFSIDELHSALGSATGARLSIARTPDDTLEQVRAKEQALAALTSQGSALERWRIAADIWCAAWFGDQNQAPGRGTFRALLERVMQDAGALPRHVADPLLAAASAIATAERFFHWTFEFPEVFYDERGDRLPNGGFDAVIGNPPWEMLRDEGGRTKTGELTSFVRGSAVYRFQGQGHANLYQLFLERALQLIKPGGRAGLILPSGFATDQSCAALRRCLLDRTTIDTFTILENRDGIFPIHRGLKFLLTTLTAAGATTELPVRPGVRSPEVLDRVPDLGAAPGNATIAVPRSLIERTSGDSLAVPDIRTALDLDIVSEIAFRVPGSADPTGWNIRFGRELNATDDRPHFTESGAGLPVVEGKQLRAFAVDTSASRYRVPVRVAAQLLDPDKTFRRPRLGYRDVAAPTNRTTLIAAIVPPGVVTTHTVFCLKDALDETEQYFLCGVFNSYVANYLVRMRVGTHVTTAIIARLPVPRLSRSDPAFHQVARLSRSLTRRMDAEAFARMNGIVARLYGLSRDHFARALETFPLIPAAERAAALRMYVSKRV